MKKQTTILVDNLHAYFAHQADAERAMNCLTHNGPYRTFQQNNGRINIISRDPVYGDFYAVIVDQLSDDTYSLRTAFRYDQTEWMKIQTRLFRKGGRFISNPPMPIVFKHAS